MWTRRQKVTKKNNNDSAAGRYVASCKRLITIAQATAADNIHKHSYHDQLQEPAQTWYGAWCCCEQCKLTIAHSWLLWGKTFFLSAIQEILCLVLPLELTYLHASIEYAERHCVASHGSVSRNKSRYVWSRTGQLRALKGECDFQWHWLVLFLWQIWNVCTLLKVRAQGCFCVR